jgi:hypothetical protein
MIATRRGDGNGLEMIMHDIEPGCEPAFERLKLWTASLMAQEFDALEDILAADFQLTAEPKFGGGRFDKAAFIAADRQITACSIDLSKVIMRRMSDTIITSLLLAQVTEEFAETAPGMPSAEEMSAMMRDVCMTYATAWRRETDGAWRCFSHHIFGFVQ